MNHEIIAQESDYGLIALYLKEGVLWDIEIDSKKYPHHYGQSITGRITKIDTSLKASIVTASDTTEYLLRNTSLPAGHQLDGIITKLSPNKIPEIKLHDTPERKKSAIERLSERTNVDKIIFEENIIDHFDLWPQIEDLLKTELETNEGRVSFEQTSALVAIDIDQSTQKSALSSNIKLAKQIAQHIILRKLSGTIMIDFIRMPHKKQRNDVEEKLKSALKTSPMPCHFHGYTHTGLYELTIERRDYPTATLLKL